MWGAANISVTMFSILNGRFRLKVKYSQKSAVNVNKKMAKKINYLQLYYYIHMRTQESSRCFWCQWKIHLFLSTV